MTARPDLDPPPEFMSAADARRHDRAHGVEVWTTVQVIGLPYGWFNRYDNNGRGGVFEQACPAMLLQEHRETLATYRPDGTIGMDRKESPPYDTRVVFANYSPDDEGTLEPAPDASNYLGTREPLVLAEDVEPS